MKDRELIDCVRGEPNTIGEKCYINILDGSVDIHITICQT